MPYRRRPTDIHHMKVPAQVTSHSDTCDVIHTSSTDNTVVDTLSRLPAWSLSSPVDVDLPVAAQQPVLSFLGNTSEKLVSGQC